MAEKQIVCFLSKIVNICRFKRYFDLNQLLYVYMYKEIYMY